MKSDDAVLRLVDRIYSAAEAPDEWPRVLDAVADALGSGMTVLFYQDLKRASAGVFATTRVSPEAVQEYADHWAARNPYFTEGADLLLPDAVIDDSMYDQTVLRGSDYYNEYLAPMNARHTIAVVLRQTGTVAAMLSMFRRRPYGTADIALVRRLQPHLRRAFRVHARLFGGANRADFSEAALDLIPTGVILLDAQASIIHMNASAQSMVRAHDGISVRDRHIHLSTAAANAFLARALKSDPPGHDRLLVERPSGKPPYSVTAAPVRRTDEPASAAIAILINDPESESPPTEALRALYGLTPAESEVAAALLRGNTVAEIAASSRVTAETIRTHLKRIFSKTSTRRQSELMRLLRSL